MKFLFCNDSYSIRLVLPKQDPVSPKQVVLPRGEPVLDPVKLGGNYGNGFVELLGTQIDHVQLVYVDLIIGKKDLHDLL
jgi:hypothetical protein